MWPWPWITNEMAPTDSPTIVIIIWLLVTRIWPYEAWNDVWPMTQCVTLTMNHKSNYTNGFSIPENLGIELLLVIICWLVTDIDLEMTYDLDPDVTLTLNHTNNGTNGFSIPENLGIEASFVIILWLVTEIWPYRALNNIWPWPSVWPWPWITKRMAPADSP